MGANIFGQGGQFSGNITASIPAVGATGAAAPSYAIELGIIDVLGHLEGVSASNPIRIDPTGTTTQPVELNDGANVMGIMAKFGATPGAVYAINANASLFAGTTALTATGTSLDVNITGGGSSGVVNVTQVSAVVNAGNSSTSALNAGLSFTGTPSIDLVTLGEITIQVQLLTDQPGTIQIQFSTDNTNWDHIITGAVIANESTSIATGIHGRYVRVVVTNTSAVNQTFMRLQTILVPGSVSPTIKDLDTVVSSDDNAMVVHAVMTGVSPTSNGVFSNVSCRPTGAIEVVSDNSVTGDFITASKRNQFDINFSGSDATDATLITNTASGSGAVTQANGQGVYSTGTAAAGQAKGVTVASIIYRPSCDIYAAFTAAFTTPTDANAAHDYQRIGLYDTNNGFFIGYEGTVFGLTSRRATVDTRVTLANFNLDKLDGAAASRFTRSGVPEVANFTYLNLFRIRFSWFGAADIYFDIFSPDGDWVPFHVIRYPNTQNIPSIATPSLPVTADVFKTSSDSTNLQIRTACWAGGVSESAIRMNDLITDATLAIPTRSVIVGHTTGGGGGYINVKVNPSGAVSAAVTAADGDVFVRSNAAATFPVTATQGPANATPWNENVAQVGGAAVAAAANTSPVGTEVLPGVRNVPRRYSQILTTANLNANVSYTSGWFDTLQTGDMVVTATAQVTGTNNGANLGFYIEEANDTAAVLPVKVAVMTGASPGSNVISGGIHARYWRVNYTQGSGGATTTFELSYTAYSSFVPATIANVAGNLGTQLVQFPFSQPNLGGSDGQTSPPQAVVYSSGSSFGNLFSSSLGWVFNGASFDKLRTPNTFKSVTATASGNTAVWTPTTGKKFRLMRYKIEISQDAVAAAGANLDVTLQDATTDIGVGHTCFIPALAATTLGGGYSSGWIDLGNGKISAAANNVLNINLSFALTGGKVRIMVCGTEE